jgi:hypothetical protein
MRYFYGYNLRPMTASLVPGAVLIRPIRPLFVQIEATNKCQIDRPGVFVLWAVLIFQSRSHYSCILTGKSEEWGEWRKPARLTRIGQGQR